MTLSTAIHNAISFFSPSILTTTIYNIVADYEGYEQVHAAKQILKEIVVQGYGEKILDLYSKKLPWQNKIKLFISEFANKTGFKEDLVTYVFECIEYGLDWLKTEPIFIQDGGQSAKKDYAEDLTNIDLDKQLVLMQKEYISMLNSLIVIPEGRLYKKSGYYPAQALSELWVVEHKIDIICAALGQDNTTWCQTEKDKVLLQYQKTKSSQMGAVFVKVLLPLFIAGGFCTKGVQYLTSSAELKEYDTNMSIGEQALANGNYADAIKAFELAENDYNGSFANKSKKKAARVKLIDAVRPLYTNAVSKSNELAAAGKYEDAKEVLIGLEQYPLDKALQLSLTDELKNLDAVITNAISDFKNTLLMIISSKGRKLDAKTLETLNELLKVAPDDYWLNFVLQKSK